jgi:hypothetical protein
LCYLRLIEFFPLDNNMSSLSLCLLDVRLEDGGVYASFLSSDSSTATTRGIKRNNSILVEKIINSGIDDNEEYDLGSNKATTLLPC